MRVVVVLFITLPLTMVGVWCASVSSMDVTNDKVEQWQSGSDKRQEERVGRLMRRYLLDGRRRWKRNSDNTHLYKDALFTSPNTAYFQKHQTHHLRCLSWRRGERLSSIFWYRGSTLVAKYSAPNERGKNFTDGERYRLVDDQSGLIIYNVTDDDEGLYDCRVVPTATKKERNGMATVEILDSAFPADAVTMDSIDMTLLSQNINRQNGGRIKCPHSSTDASATYWSLDKGEGVDTDIIGAEYSNNDTLVLDKYEEDYQIASGGDLQILSPQRPQSRFWCHRFLDGMAAVGYVNVTGVVVTNQDRPIITGCETLPGDECQVNFDPDEDLQLDCSVREVYPKVTLDWKDVSGCDINFQKESFESFDDVTKTYNQYQRLIVKAGSFSADCQPKFVCNATGVAIPVQPFGAEVIQVKTGVPGKTGIILGVLLLVGVLVLFLVFLLFVLKRRRNHLKTSSSSADIEANEIEANDTGCHLLPDESQTVRNQTSQSEEVKPVEEDESQTLLTQTSPPEELKPDKLVTEHVEIHLSGSNSFSPLMWLMQARNVVVHIHQNVREKTPTKQNRTRSKQTKYGKGGDSSQHLSMETVSETEFSPTGQQNLEVHKPKNSNSPPNMADSTLDHQENDDQQMSSSEAACEPRQTVNLHHGINEDQPEQQTSDEASSHHHLTLDEVNLQREDPLDKSISTEMVDCEDEVVERPKRDPKERLLKTRILLKKQNPKSDPKERRSKPLKTDSGYSSIPAPNPQDYKDRPPAEESSTDQFADQQVTQPVDNHDYTAEPSLADPLLDPIINHHSDEVQHLHREDPTEQPDPISTQPLPAPYSNPFQIVTSQGPPGYNPSKEEQETPSTSLPDIPQTQTRTPPRPSLYTESPGSNTINRGFDDSPKIGIPESSLPTSPQAPLSDQDDQLHVPLAVVPPHSDYREPTPGVGLDSNGSRHPNHFQSDNKDMPSSSIPDLNPLQQDDVKDPTAEETSTNQSADQQVTQPVDNHDCTAEPSPSDPLLDPITNQHSVQQPHREDPTKEEQEAPSSSLPDIPQTQTGMQLSPSFNPSLGSNMNNRGLDDSSNVCTLEPLLPTSTQAPLADQDKQLHVPLAVFSPKSDDREPTPGVCLDSNGSRHPNRFQSDDEDMDSVTSASANEMEDETISVEMEDAVDVESTQVSPPDIEMVDSKDEVEDEVVERPKSDPKERQSKFRIEQKKRNPLKTDNLLAQRPKVLTVH